MSFFRDNEEEKINAYLGSRAEWEEVGGWDTFWPPRVDRTPSSRRGAFRGGELLSENAMTGDIGTKL